MTTSRYSGLGDAEFEQAVNYLPAPGRAFSGDPDTVQSTVFGPIAAVFAAHHAAVMQALDVELDTGLTTELLPEWESDYGLPDPCTPVGSTVAQRRAALRAKRASLGGQSIAYYINVAAVLGFTVTITEFRLFRFGISHFGDPIPAPSWAFAWRVNVAAITGTVDASEFECRIRTIAPAHTVVLFAYS